MRAPITPELLADLAAKHGDDRIEHLVHPDELQYEVVVRTPRLAEFKKWKRSPDRAEAAERLMALCLVYPSHEDWEAMLDERPALADTFGADIPRLVGATPDDCIAEDPELVEAVAERMRLAPADLRVIRHPRYPECTVVLRRPKRDAYKRFKMAASTKGKELDSIETLLIDCIVEPSLDDWKAMADRMPGIVDSFGSAAVKFAGGSSEFTGKK